jgi:hypothetical protein
MMGGVIVLSKMQNTRDLPERLYGVLTYEVMEAFLVVALKTQKNQGRLGPHLDDALSATGRKMVFTFIFRPCLLVSGMTLSVVCNSIKVTIYFSDPT